MIRNVRVSLLLKTQGIYIENNTYPFLYHSLYELKTPISARGAKAQGMIFVEG